MFLTYESNANFGTPEGGVISLLNHCYGRITALIL
jgi:hypothetical protein